MSDAFSTPSNRIKALILLAICGLLAIAAVVVGIDDNLPGILLASVDENLTAKAGLAQPNSRF